MEYETKVMTPNKKRFMFPRGPVSIEADSKEEAHQKFDKRKSKQKPKNKKKKLKGNKKKK